MHPPDKRDYYRITDDIEVAYRSIRRSEIENTDPGDHFDLGPTFNLLPELYELDLQISEAIRHLNQAEKPLGSVLHKLNRRVALLGRAVIGDQFAETEMPSPARISEGGISFVTDELMHVGTQLAMRLLFKPSMLGIVCFGEVRHCRLVDHGDAYIAGVRFTRIDATSQRLISRHIIHLQAEERRERLRRSVDV